MQKPDEGKAKAVADLERRLAMLGNVDEPLPPPAFEELPPPSMSPPPPPAYNNMSAPMAPPPPAYQFSAPPPPAYQFSAPSMPPPAVEAPPAASIAKPASASASAATTGSSRSGKDALMARIQAAKEKAQKEKAAKATPPPPAPPAYHAPPPSMPMAPPSMPMAPPAYDSMPPSYDAMPPPPPPSSPPAFDSMAFPPPPPIDAIAPPPLPSYMATPAASAPSFESLHTIQDDAAPQNNQHNHYANLHAMPPPAAAPAMDADILAALDPAEREQILEEQRQMLAQFENKNSTSKQPLSASDPAEDFDVAKAMAQFDDLDAQMQEDMKVAEELQKKEYGTAINAKSVAEKKKKASEAQSWYSWMTGKEENENDNNNNAESSSKSKSSRSSSSEYPANTTSTSTSASASRGPRLVAAQTGDETPSVSRDDDDDSKKRGLFASAFGTPQEEATLVAVPQFSRQRN